MKEIIEEYKEQFFCTFQEVCADEIKCMSEEGSERVSEWFYDRSVSDIEDEFSYLFKDLLVHNMLNENDLMSYFVTESRRIRKDIYHEFYEEFEETKMLHNDPMKYYGVSWSDFV